MARGLKIAKGNSVQVDSASSPTRFTYPSSTSSSATVYRGGTGGIASQDTQTLVIQVNYKDSAGNAYTDGQIIAQKGEKQFNVQSAAGGAATLSRCVLTPVAPGSLTASQCSIKAVSPTGDLFYAAKISDRYVWTSGGDSAYRYPYLLGTTAAVTYDDTTSTTGVVVTDSVGGTYDNVYALVEGF